MKHQWKLKFYHSVVEEELKLPLFSTPVVAGFPSPADDHVDEKLDLNRLLIKHPAATFYVRVEGNSMEDGHIQEGDILVVDRALHPKNGDIIVAVRKSQARHIGPFVLHLAGSVLLEF